MIFTFSYKKVMIRKFPSKCQKEDSVYNTGENEFPRSAGAFPGFHCPPTQCFPASVIARRRCPIAGACVIAIEALYNHQDRRCTFKSDPRGGEMILA